MDSPSNPCRAHQLCAVVGFIILFVPIEVISGPFPLETNSVFQVVRQREITTIDELISVTGSQPRNVVLAFTCRRIYPSFKRSPDLVAELKKRGIDVPEQTPAEAGHFIGAWVGESLAYVGAGSPIEQIGTKWGKPVTVTFLTNGLVFTGAFYDQKHTVTGNHFTNYPNQFGFPANEGFSVQRVMLGLDLENIHAQAEYDSRNGRLRVVDSAIGGERDYAITRDGSGSAASILARRNGLEYSLVSSNGTFIYQVSSSGNIESQFLYENVYVINQPDQVLGRLWTALFPSPETLVSFHGKSTNFIYQAGKINFSAIERSIPCGTRSSAAQPTSSMVRWILIIGLLGGLAVIVTLASKHKKENPA